MIQIRTARILPRAPMIAARRFGLIDPGWPAHRQGRFARPAGARKTRVERRFRRSALVSLPQAAAQPAPINLAVTNLTLSPRFAMIWQDWRKGIKRLEREVLRDTSRDVLEIRRETELAGQRRARRKLPDSPVKGASRALVERFPGGTAEWNPKVLRGNSLAPEGRSQELSANRVARRLRWSRWIEIQERRFSRRSMLFATERAGTVFESPESRALRFLTSTVTRRRMQFLNGDPSERPRGRPPLEPELPVAPGLTRPESPSAAQVFTPLHSAPGLPVAPRVARPERPLAAQAYAPPHAAQRLSDASSSRVTDRAAPPTQRVLRAVKSDASRVTGRENPPAERVFRAETPAAPPASPAPVPATPVAVPQAPPIDIGKLDTLLWQRFEKRLRIERERRGRA